MLAILVSFIAGGLIGGWFMAACRLVGRKESELEDKRLEAEKIGGEEKKYPHRDRVYGKSKEIGELE